MDVRLAVVYAAGWTIRKWKETERKGLNEMGNAVGMHLGTSYDDANNRKMDPQNIRGSFPDYSNGAPHLLCPYKRRRCDRANTDSGTRQLCGRRYYAEAARQF